MSTDKASTEKNYKGMHNGTVSGKGFEKSRRSRKSHQQRKSEISSRSRGK